MEGIEEAIKIVGKVASDIRFADGQSECNNREVWNENNYKKV
jgi:hypothetical protein